MSLATEIDPSTLLCAFDLQRDGPILESKGKTMQCVKVVPARGKLSLKITGHTNNDNIEISPYGPHTLSITVEDQEQIDALARLNEVFSNVPGIGEDWKITEFLKGDRIYLKLKQKGTGYAPRSNIKLNSKTLVNPGIYRYQNLTVQMDLMAYFNLETKTCGIYFDIYNLTFEK